jgi:tetratricopeptide (TPR) repeat protein
MAHGIKGTPPEDVVSPTAGDSNLVKALDDAMALIRAGRLDQAKADLEEVLRNHPGSAGAVHFLGLIAHQEGDQARAVELLEKAVTMNRVVPFFHGNLGEVYRALGRYTEAIASCRKAVELFPVYPEALNTLGAALLEQGEVAEAEATLRRALEFKPDLAAAHGNLGNVLKAQGNLEPAVAAFERAARHAPNLPDVHLALGNALHACGRLDDAIASYRAALAINPRDAKIWSSLGRALRSTERNDEALECLQKAVALEPDLADAHTNLGTVHMVLGRMDKAVECYATALELKRTPTWSPTGGERAPRSVGTGLDHSFRYTTPAKLRHDIEQYRFLMDKKLLPAAFDGEIARYEEILEEIGSTGGRTALTTQQRTKIAGTYNKLVHLARAPALETSPLNPVLDVDAIESDYFANGPGVTHFDDLLKPEALEALRKFCLESTIWFDFEHEEGYLGAYLSDGFSNELLFQIAEDLRRKFPKVFGERPLRQMWAYKYDSRIRGIGHHADAAAVNVNFWITPDGANRDPDSGGLVVYTREAPLEWDFDKYNRDDEPILNFLGESDSVTVPYRQNRAVMFNSNLFHKTDKIRFKEGYENRRINITMLFGLRGDAPKVQ